MRILKKTVKYILVLVTFLLCALFGTNVYVRVNVKNRIISLDKAKSLSDVDCILVLGASVKEDETPSLMLKDRLDKGVELYFAGCSPKLLMSGDHGGMYYNEVSVMKNYAKKASVPGEDIFMDHAGFSTYDSMYRAKHIFNADKVIIVSQRYHLYRSLYIARQLGIDAYGVAAEDIKYSNQTFRDIREILAITKDFAKAAVKPEAAMMGECISLDGDGDKTNDRP